MSNTEKSNDKASDQGSLPIITIDGPKALIRFNRPAVLNRIQPEDIELIVKSLDEFEASDDIRVVIFTGTGRVFSSGFNLNVFNDLIVKDPNHRKITAEDNFFAPFTDRIEKLRVPTILAANGPVYGGATDVALACDFRYAVEGVEAFLPASRLGIHYYERGMERCIARLGLAAAKRICLTSETINQDELLACGFFDGVMAEEKMWERVNNLASTIVKQAPLAVVGMKRALNQISYGELDREKTTEAFLQCLNSDDFKEGVSAWFEKRQPVFTSK